MANEDVVWVTVGFCILSLAVVTLLIGLTCYNEFTKPDLTICGSTGIYICCGVACKYQKNKITFNLLLFELQDRANDQLQTIYTILFSMDGLTQPYIWVSNKTLSF